MSPIQDSLTVETDLFEHREVKPHFINDCCFGEDFAQWLRPKIAELPLQELTVDDPIQEDYGWGFWVRSGRERCWVALSFVGVGPTEEPAQWVVSLSYNPRAHQFHSVRDRIWTALKSTDAIRVIPNDRTV